MDLRGNFATEPSFVKSLFSVLSTNLTYADEE
jgi:hypothetical protein